MSTTFGGYSFTLIPPLPPGGSSTISVSHPNAEAYSGKVSQGLLFISLRQAGIDPDPAIGERVIKRLGSPVVHSSAVAGLDFPYRAMAFQAVDEMTAHVEPDPLRRNAEQHKEVSNVLEVIKYASDHGILPEVLKLATSPRLKNKDELGARLHKMTSTHDNSTLPSFAGLFREFETVAGYLEQHPDAEVIWDSDYIHTDGKKYQGDLIALYRDHVGNLGKVEVLQLKTMYAATFWRHLNKTAEQFTGLRRHDKPAGAKAEKAPPESYRIAVLILEAGHGTKWATNLRAAADRKLSRKGFLKKLKANPSLRTTLCRNGKPALDLIRVINARGTLDIPFAELGVKC